jgi:hypothetical protein
MEQVETGQEVYSADGERLGKVIAATDHTIVIEKGFFLPTDFAARRSDIAEVSGGAVRLSKTRAELESEAEKTDLAPDAAADRELTSAGAQAMAEAGQQEIPGTPEREGSDASHHP